MGKPLEDVFEWNAGFSHMAKSQTQLSRRLLGT